MMTFCKNLKHFRLAKNYTQEQAAQALGVSAQSVSRWECGTTLPDVTMLPKIAALYGVTIDKLYGIRYRGCTGNIPEDKKDFLLQTYSQMYAPEAGPWNVSVENKYLEYRFADFFQKHFPVHPETDICNIGIGAGEWDIFLSYQLKGGTLTSIDRLEICCRQLEERLICEGNPNAVKVICSNVMELDLDGRFDIVTMVGSTITESGIGLELLEKAMGFVRPGGSVYFQSLEENEDCNAVIQTAFHQGMKLAAFFEDDRYGIHCHYYKFERA